MHGERVGITPHPEIAAGYALVALFFVACAKWANPPALAPTAEAEHHG